MENSEESNIISLYRQLYNLKKLPERELDKINGLESKLNEILLRELRKSKPLSKIKNIM